MSRNTDAAVTSASQLPQVQYQMLCEVYSTSGGTVRTCTGDKFLYAAPSTYTPVGPLGGAEAINEGSDVFARAVRIWFAAINSSQIADVLSENMYSKPVKLYRCFVTDSYTVVGTPQLAFYGYASAVNMQLGDTARGNYFEIEAESRLVQPTRARYLDKETHWVTMGYSGDTFFTKIAQIPLATVNWGNLANGQGTHFVKYTNPTRGNPGYIAPDTGTWTRSSDGTTPIFVPDAVQKTTSPKPENPSSDLSNRGRMPPPTPSPSPPSDLSRRGRGP
jgi:hypothetical protein